MVKKYKMLGVATIASILIVFIFSLTMFPSVQPNVSKLPVAIVNEDAGATKPDGTDENIGQQIIAMTAQIAGTEQGEKVEFITVDSLEQMLNGMDNKEYYAALYIPEDFSAKQASLLSPAPEAAQLTVYVNQGMNPTAATMANQMLTTMTGQFSETVKTKILEVVGAQGLSLTANQVTVIASPIQTTVNIVHGVGENSANGNSPVLMFQPTWIASMVAAALLYVAINKLKDENRRKNVVLQLIALLCAIVIAILIGLTLTLLAKHMVGLSIIDVSSTIWFIALSSIAFITMIYAFMSLVGFGVVPLFGLVLFFGAPLLSLAPEMMSDFYRDFINPWLPMRFMVGGLREIFFFEAGLVWNNNVATLLWIAIGSAIVALLAGFKKKQQVQSEINNM